MNDSKINARTKTRAVKARDKVQRMIAEVTQWKGVKPTVVRVNHGDYLALVECGWADKFPNIEVKPG